MWTNLKLKWIDIRGATERLTEQPEKDYWVSIQGSLSLAYMKYVPVFHLVHLSFSVCH